MFKVKFSELYFEREQKALSGKTGSKAFRNDELNINVHGSYIIQGSEV
jgi:hypothetical protein